MNVTCILCDQTHELDSRTFQAKRLRNKPITMYICEECDHRIALNTIHRLNTGKFDFHKPYKKPFIEASPKKG